MWALCSGFANVTQALSKCLQGTVSGDVFPGCSTDVSQTVLLLICYLHLENFRCCFHRWRNRALFGTHPDSPHQRALGQGAGTSLHAPGTNCGSAELSSALLPGYTELLLPLWGAVLSSHSGLNPREKRPLEHGRLPEEQRNAKSDDGPEMG